MFSLDEEASATTKAINFFKGAGDSLGYTIGVMRDSINKPLSTIAKTKALRKLERLSNGDTDKAVAILDQSTDSFWEGLYDLPENQTVGQRNPKVQAAYGFSTERNTDLNSIVWEQIRKGWEEDGES